MNPSAEFNATTGFIGEQGSNFYRMLPKRPKKSRLSKNISEDPFSFNSPNNEGIETTWCINASFSLHVTNIVRPLSSVYL